MKEAWQVRLVAYRHASSSWRGRLLATPPPMKSREILLPFPQSYFDGLQFTVSVARASSNAVNRSSRLEAIQDAYTHASSSFAVRRNEDPSSFKLRRGGFRGFPSALFVVVKYSQTLEKGESIRPACKLPDDADWPLLRSSFVGNLIHSCLLSRSVNSLPHQRQTESTTRAGGTSPPLWYLPSVNHHVRIAQAFASSAGGGGPDQSRSFLLRRLTDTPMSIKE